jgi:hypothetical protein
MNQLKGDKKNVVVRTPQNKRVGEVNSGLISRRLEILILEGLGVSRVDIAKQLSQKYKCSQRSVYNDFETKTAWQPELQGATKANEAILKIINRYEQIYSQASKRAISSPNPFVQLAALNLMCKVNSNFSEVAAAPEILARIKALEDKIAKGDFSQ